MTRAERNPLMSAGMLERFALAQTVTIATTAARLSTQASSHAPRRSSGRWRSIGFAGVLRAARGATTWGAGGNA